MTFAQLCALVGAVLVIGGIAMSGVVPAGSTSFLALGLMALIFLIMKMGRPS